GPSVSFKHSSTCESLGFDVAFNMFCRLTAYPSRANCVNDGQLHRSASTPQSLRNSAAASITSRKIVPEPSSWTRGDLAFLSPALNRYMPFTIAGAAPSGIEGCV